MIEIKPKQIKKNCSVDVPGSKSCTHRALIAAALACGKSMIKNPLKSEDTLLTAFALQKMGIKIEDKDDKFIVYGRGGKFESCQNPIYLKNSGTSMRLLTSLASLGRGKYIFTGNNRLCKRPMKGLTEALNQIGVSACSINNDGCPPIEIFASQASKKEVKIKCNESSQYLSGFLLMAPYTEKGLEISTAGEVVSKPYIDITIDVMAKFGVRAEKFGYEKFIVKGRQCFKPQDYKVEPDASNAGYFWGAAAITGSAIKVNGINKFSVQGDIKFVKILEKMGCKAVYENDGILLIGSEKLKPIEVDMADMPDMAPTLAVVAAFAEGVSVIKNVNHLKAKESDRLTAVTSELDKIGIEAFCDSDKMTIYGGEPKGARVKTYDDHRIAMSFAMAGLKTAGIIIENEECVKKSFPDFWDIFTSISPHKTC